MSQAYQQFELDEDSKQGTTGSHTVSSAPGIFQRTVENHTVDDILITGRTEEEHLRNLAEVFKRLREAGLKLKRNKCFFLAKSVVYLGHTINADGLHPTPDNSRLFKMRHSQLTCRTEILHWDTQFLYQQLTLAPLYTLLHKVKDVPWRWTDEEQAVFATFKQLLTSSQILVYFDPDKPLILSCDASQYGIGAVLSHRTEDGAEKPIGFASHTLSAAEKNY